MDEKREWRRFIPIQDTTELEKLIKRKELSHEDLTLILKSIKLNKTILDDEILSTAIYEIKQVISNSSWTSTDKLSALQEAVNQLEGLLEA